MEDRSPLAVFMLGIGDFFSKKYYHAGFVLFLDGFPVMVDCQDHLPKVIHEACIKSGIDFSLDNLDHIILTHLHGDHSNGLECLGFYNFYIRKKKPVIYTIPEVKEVMWDQKLKAAMGPKTDENFKETGEMSMDDFFQVKTLSENEPNHILGMKLEIRRTKHYVPCFGLKAEFQGRKLGYSSDTAFDPGHIEFLSDCDLILHETNKGGHTKYEKLASLPEDIKKKMLLVHIWDEFDPATSDMRVAEEGYVYYV